MLPNDVFPPEDVGRPPKPSNQGLLPDRLPTGMALRSHGMYRQMARHYVETLDELVFCNVPDHIDRKDRKSFERKLRSENARLVLEIVWKESEWVLDSDLSAAEMFRFFERDELYAHKLAVELAAEPRDVAQLNSEIRSIVIASEAFGLIDRIEVCSTRVRLRGTRLLHGLMTRISEKDYSLFASSTEPEPRAVMRGL